MLTTVPPRIGSKRPGDLLATLATAWRLRKLDERGVGDLTRLMTMSVADLLEERFESPELRGVLAVSGIIGTWAGPRSPGTAYVMAHHRIGTVGDGQLGTWGFPEGGMGAVTEAMRRAAEGFGATIRTGAEVARIDVLDGQVRGVILDNGDEYQADVVIATTHPKITFLRHLERAALPDDFVAAIERWKTRSGTVKVNLALDRLPEFTSAPGFDPGGARRHHRAGPLARRHRGRVPGRRGRPAGRACRSPTSASRRCSTARWLRPASHVMSMFTQWVPHQFADAPHRDELDAYADRAHRPARGAGPRLHRRASCTAR